MLKIIARFLKVLGSETDPGQISLGLCFSMVAGLTPLFSLHNLFVLLFVLVLRVNLASFILGFGIFSAAAYLLDPLFHLIGLAVLTSGVLKPLWVVLYNMVLFRLEHFNNTIVMGSLIFSAVLFIPLYLVSNLLIRRYRESVLGWVQKLKIVQVLKASKLFAVYRSLAG